MPLVMRYTTVEAQPKADGSVRSVSNPHFLIRKIQRRLNKRIFSNGALIGWPDYIFGSIPNQFDALGVEADKDYIACAARHCGAKSILHLDVQSFFDNIHRTQVLAIFEDFLKYSEAVSDQLADICCNGENLVQGALTSSYLATLCLWDVEGEMVNRLNRKSLTYTRFVDDITISSKVASYDFSYAQGIVQDMLASKDLPINSGKTRVRRISSEALTVHGLRVNFSQPRLPSDEVRRIRSSVQNVEKLAVESNYRQSHSYRKDFNRCMGRVNKLKRVGHKQHADLLKRLREILPLPSFKDIERAHLMVARLKDSYQAKGDSFWYRRRFYATHERLTILDRSFHAIAVKLRGELRLIRPSYD